VLRDHSLPVYVYSSRVAASGFGVRGGASGTKVE